ncbi:MAG: family 20 glycosylhydrolase, partial [Gemmatimonadota bacterium]
EAPKDRWEESPLAQEVIHREGLADEDELQSWFIRRIEGFLNRNGRRLIGWDEILEGGLAPDATVMSWRGVAGGVAAAKQGHDVIMTPNSYLYLDYYQGDTGNEPLAIGGFSPLERVYSFEPVPQGLSPQEARHILGAQANLWTEYIPTTEQVEYMLLPRLLALSEVVWTASESRDWGHFLARMAAGIQRLDRMGANYRIPDVFGLEEDRLILEDSVPVELFAPIRDGEIRYTLTGQDPGPGDPVYEGPFVFYPGPGGTEIRARVALPDGRMGAVKTASVRKAELIPATPLPRSHRSQGLLARVFPGTYPSVDSLPRGFSHYPGGARAAFVPRVEIPELAPATTYGATLTGFIRIPRDGIYTFYLTSDDGSDLWVARERVVNNDGYHGMSERRGQAALKRGWHPLEIHYFQGGGDADLRLELEGPHTRRREVPAHWLSRHATALERQGIEARIAIDPGHPSETSPGHLFGN